MIDGLAFIGSYCSPPDYRCAQAGGACSPLGPSEWVCGPFSMVRAMRRLGALVDAAGLPEIAKLCWAARPGYVESKLNQELDRVPYRDDQERWFRVNELKMTARKIRKWSVEP